MIVAESNWYTTIMGEMLYDLAGVGCVDFIKDRIAELTDKDVLASITALSGTIELIASMFLMIYFLCYLLEMSTKEQLTMDIFFKGFLKFLIGFWLAHQAVPLFNLFMKFGNVFMDGVTKAVQNPQGFDKDALIAAVGEKFKDAGFGLPEDFDILSGKSWARLFAALGTILLQGIQLPTTFLFWAITWVSNLVVVLVAVSRMLEMAVRLIFAPLAIVDVFEHGTNGAGFRYIKKFLALAIQGGVILMIIAMVGPLSGFDVADPKKFVDNTVLVIDTEQGYCNFGDVFACGFNNVVYRIASIGLVLKSQPICNDIMGV